MDTTMRRVVTVAHVGNSGDGNTRWR